MPRFQTFHEMREVAAPATPATGYVRVYAKSDGLVYSKDDAGVETVVTGGGGSASGTKVSALPAATTPLDGTGLVPIVQAGVSKQVTVADLALRPAWAGNLHTAVGSGEPEVEWQNNFLYIPGAALTPTLVTATVGRIWSYKSPYAITVNRLRWMQTAGTAAASNFRFGIYNPALSGNAQQILAPQTLTFTATANSWTSHSISSLTLAADTLYYCCLSATAVSTTWSMRATGPTAVGPPLQASSPGNLAIASAKHRYWFGQVALTNGVQPATMPTLVQSAAWATAGLPAFFFDNSSAA